MFHNPSSSSGLGGEAGSEYVPIVGMGFYCGLDASGLPVNCASAHSSIPVDLTKSNLYGGLLSGQVGMFRTCGSDQCSRGIGIQGVNGHLNQIDSNTFVQFDFSGVVGLGIQAVELFLGGVDSGDGVAVYVSAVLGALGTLAATLTGTAAMSATSSSPLQTAAAGRASSCSEPVAVQINSTARFVSVSAIAGAVFVELAECESASACPA